MNGKSYMFCTYYLNHSLPLYGVGTMVTPILQVLDLSSSERVHCLSKITQLLRGGGALELSSVHCQSQVSVHQVTVFKGQTFVENLLCVKPWGQYYDKYPDE